MTDYVKSTNFTSKDSLAVGNPLKIIKGAEFDTEFNNIATAVATKANIADPTFTGTVAAPTPALSAAGTTVATVAAIQALYPVGSIYINAGVTTNPGTLLGFGTWVAFGAGRVMVGLNSADVLFDTLEETGGSKDATVVSHTHTYSGTTSNNTDLPLFGGSAYSSPAYQAGTTIANVAGGATAFLLTNSTTTTGSLDDHTHTYSGTTASTGSSGTNANLQPYITVAMWKRTA